MVEQIKNDLRETVNYIADLRESIATSEQAKHELLKKLISELLKDGTIYDYTDSHGRKITLFYSKEELEKLDVFFEKPTKLVSYFLDVNFTEFLGISVKCSVTFAIKYRIVLD